MNSIFINTSIISHKAENKVYFNILALGRLGVATTCSPGTSIILVAAAFVLLLRPSLVRLKIATAGKRVGILAFAWGEHLFFVRLFIPPTAIFSQIFLMRKYGCSSHR